MERIGPKGVLPGVGIGRGRDDVVVERYLLAFLIEEVVAVSILQGKHPIGACGNALDDEVAPAVGARNANHGFRGEERVALSAYLTLRNGRIEPHENTLDGLQILSFEHIARHFHRVDGLPRGEAVGVVAHRVVLVVVADGIGEIDGVGGVRFQRIKQLHLYVLSAGLDFGHFELRGRNDDLLRGVVELDKLVEVDAYLLRFHIHSPVCRTGPYHPRRCLVIPSAVGLAHAGAGREK